MFLMGTKCEPNLVGFAKKGSIEKNIDLGCVIMVDIKTGVGWLSCHVHALTCQHQLARVVAGIISNDDNKYILQFGQIHSVT